MSSSLLNTTNTDITSVLTTLIEDPMASPENVVDGGNNNNNDDDTQRDPDYQPSQPEELTTPPASRTPVERRLRRRRRPSSITTTTTTTTTDADASRPTQRPRRRRSRREQPRQEETTTTTTTDSSGASDASPICLNDSLSRGIGQELGDECPICQEWCPSQNLLISRCGHFVCLRCCFGMLRENAKRNMMMLLICPLCRGMTDMRAMHPLTMHTVIPPLYDGHVPRNGVCARCDYDNCTSIKYCTPCGHLLCKNGVEKGIMDGCTDSDIVFCVKCPMRGCPSKFERTRIYPVHIHLTHKPA